MPPWAYTASATDNKSKFYKLHELLLELVV